VVWNMALQGGGTIRHYLGAELSHVDKSMTIVAPDPTRHRRPSVIPALARPSGVAYVLTGHTHSNRNRSDHDGVIELNTPSRC